MSKIFESLMLGLQAQQQVFHYTQIELETQPGNLARNPPMRVCGRGVRGQLKMLFFVINDRHV